MSAVCHHISILAAAGVAAACLYGCRGGPDAPGTRSLTEGPAIVGTVEPVATVVDARPAALVGGRSVTWGELRPLLNEIGGAAALRELVLDGALEAEIQRAAIEITDSDVAYEQRLLLEALSDDPERALRLLTELRTRQGLGTVRFARMLRRNAMLRALVRSRVNVNEASIGRMYEILHGTKRQSRMILVDSLSEANTVLARLSRGEPFADVAVDISTDSSAPRGGLLEPVAREDPSYPDALRRTLWTLEVGDVSSPVLLDGGYAVLQLVREIPRDGTELDATRPELEKAVRRSQERVLMDELARHLLREVSVTIFDDTLHESWTRGRGAGPT